MTQESFAPGDWVVDLSDVRTKNLDTVMGKVTRVEMNYYSRDKGAQVWALWGNYAGARRLETPQHCGARRLRKVPEEMVSNPEAIEAWATFVCAAAGGISHDV